MFATESCLREFEKLAHGSTRLCEQICFWWSILRQARSKEVRYSRRLFTDEQPILDGFFDQFILNSYRQEFDLVFNQMFGEFPVSSLKYYSRYQRGLIVYHSLSYTRRCNCDSYSVCVLDGSNRIKFISYHGEIIFFFNMNGESFCFIKRYVNSNNLFSSLLKPIHEVSNWKKYIDKWYQIIQHSTFELVIYPCSSIMSKCIFFRLDNDFTVCTQLEFETEHD